MRELRAALIVVAGMLSKDVATWNRMIAACVHNGRSQEARAIHTGIRQDGTHVSDQDFLCAFASM